MRDGLKTLELDILEKVTMRLKCAKCGHTGRFTFDTIFIDDELRDRSPANPSDYMSFDAYFRCSKCKSAWPWEFTNSARLTAMALMAARLVGIKDERVVCACPRLDDGTPYRSGAQAEEHLLAVLESEPENAFVWSRLGNVYKRADMFAKASNAFSKALELDPSDLDTHYSFGYLLFDHWKDKLAAEHLNRVVWQARDYKGIPEEYLRLTVMSAVDMLAEIWHRSNGKIGITPSITEAEQREPLRSLRLESFDLQKEDERERLVDMLVGKRRSFASPVVPRPRGVPKVGRNEPCPCGSGRKYKKCCGE